MSKISLRSFGRKFKNTKELVGNSELKQRLVELEEDLEKMTENKTIVVVEKWNGQTMAFEKVHVLNTNESAIIGDYGDPIHKNYTTSHESYYRFSEYQVTVLKMGVSMLIYEQTLTDISDKRKLLTEIEMGREREIFIRERFIERWGAFFTGLAIFLFFLWLSQGNLFGEGSLNQIMNSIGKIGLVLAGLGFVLTIYGLFKFYVLEKRKGNF